MFFLQSLLENGQLEEALALGEGCSKAEVGSDPRLHSLISRVRVQSGFKALKEVDTDRARQLFLEGGLDPREVVRYFETTLTPRLSEAIETGRSMEEPCHNFARFSGVYAKV